MSDIERFSRPCDFSAPVTKEEAIDQELFVCYECRDDRCGYCIGVPCMCPCPIPATEPEYFL